MYSAHMGADGPLGTDSRQWAGIIWWMRSPLPPHHHTPPFHNQISCSLASFLSLRWSESGGICYILYSCWLVCVWPQGRVTSEKKKICVQPPSSACFSSLSLCCSTWVFRKGRGVMYVHACVRLCLKCKWWGVITVGITRTRQVFVFLSSATGSDLRFVFLFFLLTSVSVRVRDVWEQPLNAC